MKNTIFIGVILSSFLLLATPCIHAVQRNEIKNDIENKIQNNAELKHFVPSNEKNYKSINLAIIKILAILYMIGFFAFIPIGLVIIGHLDEDGHFDLDNLFDLIIGCLLWPYILLDIIRAYIQDFSYINLKTGIA